MTHNIPSILIQTKSLYAFFTSFTLFFYHQSTYCITDPRSNIVNVTVDLLFHGRFPWKTWIPFLIDLYFHFYGPFPMFHKTAYLLRLFFYFIFYFMNVFTICVFFLCSIVKFLSNFYRICKWLIYASNDYNFLGNLYAYTNSISIFVIRSNSIRLCTLKK